MPTYVSILNTKVIHNKKKRRRIGFGKAPLRELPANKWRYINHLT